MLARRLLPCLIVLACCPSICFSQVKLPTDTPSGQVCAAWLQAFNSGDRDTYRTFLEKYSPARLDRLDSAMEFRSRTGGLDGYPGLRGWGAKSSAAVLAKFGHLESIPPDFREWRVNVASERTLADTLLRERDQAMLFRRLATLRTDIALFEDVEQLRWKGPTPRFDALASGLDTAVTGPRRVTRR